MELDKENNAILFHYLQPIDPIFTSLMKTA